MKQEKSSYETPKDPENIKLYQKWTLNFFNDSKNNSNISYISNKYPLRISSTQKSGYLVNA